MNPKKSRKKSLIHENADANITCDFGDGDISRLGVAYLIHVIGPTYIASSIIVKWYAFNFSTHTATILALHSTKCVINVSIGC